MSLGIYKLLAALLILITTVIGIAYPLRMRKLPIQHLIINQADAFASGVFLGAALFHMLPDAIKIFQQILPNIEYPLAELCCLCGFLLLLLLENISNHSSKKKNISISFIVTITICIHALIEGTALGINTLLAEATIIFIAIFFHKGSESFALSLVLCREKNISNQQLFIMIGIFSMMTPLGIALGTTMTHYLALKQGKILNASFNAFAAGTFLYMSTLHHVHAHQHSQEEHHFQPFLFLSLGVALMGIVVLWV